MTLEDRVETTYRIDYRSEEDPGSNDETGPWYFYQDGMVEDHAKRLMFVAEKSFGRLCFFRMTRETKVIYSEVLLIQRGS